MNTFNNDYSRALSVLMVLCLGTYQPRNQMVLTFIVPGAG